MWNGQQVRLSRISFINQSTANEVSPEAKVTKDMKLLNKLTTILVMIIATIISANAQSSQIATLNHEGNITNYTSGTALTDALAAAVDGDVISLSSGIFQAPEIKKNVTIRGAGMGYPELGGTVAPTILTGENGNRIIISCPESADNNLVLEGLVHNGYLELRKAKNATLSKCQFREIQSYSGDGYDWNNIRFIHCIISNVKSPEITSVQFVNSVISKECNLSSSAATQSFQFDNCVVYTGAFVNNSSMTNSIVVLQKGSAYQTSIDSSSSLNHCIIAGCQNYNVANGGNKFCNASEIFASEGLYTLTETMKEFKGTDGTEVGIYGGSLPFSPVSTNLRITKFKVAERTTADGKLPIEIEIESY